MPLTPEERALTKLRAEENRQWLSLRKCRSVLRRIEATGPKSPEDTHLLKQVFHLACAKLDLDMAERLSMDLIDGESSTP